MIGDEPICADCGAATLGACDRCGAALCATCANCGECDACVSAAEFANDQRGDR